MRCAHGCGLYRMHVLSCKVQESVVFPTGWQTHVHREVHKNSTEEANWLRAGWLETCHQDRNLQAVRCRNFIAAFCAAQGGAS